MAKRTLSAQRQARKSERRRLKNRERKLALKKALKEFAAAKDKTEAARLLPRLQSLLDRAARRGIIARNKANRLKSQTAVRQAEKQ